jgi:hypothetical protein
VLLTRVVPHVPLPTIAGIEVAWLCIQPCGLVVSGYVNGEHTRPDSLSFKERDLSFPPVLYLSRPLLLR